MATLKELLKSRAELVGQNRAILDRAESEDNRSLNSEERSEYDKRDEDIEKLCTEIEELQKKEDTAGDIVRRERSAKLTSMLAERQERQTTANPPTPRAKGTDGAAELSIDFGRAGDITLAPNDPVYHRASKSYNAAFNSMLRGDKRDWESLGLEVSSDPKGGYLAPIQLLGLVIKFLDNLVFLRRLGTVLPPTNAKSVGMVSWDTDYNNADWTAEVTAADIAEDDTARVGGRELQPHLVAKLIKLSQKLVRSYPAIQTFVAQRLSYIFGITEETAFYTGDGVGKPLGLFTASPMGISTSFDITASSATDFTADDLIDWVYDLKDPYVQNATVIASRLFRRKARKLKDGTGNYLLVEGERNNSGTLSAILDVPLVCSEYVPNTFTTGLYVAIVGDMSFYWIQDSLGLEIQTLLELFTLRNQVGMIARKETDAMPVLGEAFRRLKLA